MLSPMRRQLRRDEAAYRLCRIFLSLYGPSCGPAHPHLPDENWNALFAAIEDNRVSPLAYWVARELRLDVRPDLARQFAAAFYGAALRIEQIEAALAVIDDAFAGMHVDAILLKGISLAKAVYPVTACRPMEDIDLLVRGSDLGRAGSILESLGYSDKAYGVEDFRNPMTGVDVDLHTDCLNANRVPARRLAWNPDVEELLTRTQSFQPLRNIRTLGLSDQLIYLCHHAWLHHGLHGALRLLDVSLVFRQLPNAEKAFLGIPSQTKRAFWYTLCACHSRLAPILFESMGRILRPEDASPLERSIHRLAIRGQLPECARYAYLWFAIPAGKRLKYLGEMIPAGWRMLSAKAPA